MAGMGSSLADSKNYRETENRGSLFETPMPTNSSSGSTTPRIGIVLVTFNKVALTLECLQSLAQLDYPNFQIIVVDNHSSDHSPAIIQAQFPNVHVSIQSNNLGFAGGSNCGIQIALELTCEYILLLNNDTTVAPTLLSDILKVFEANAAVGIVGTRICYYDEPTKVWFGGGCIEWQSASVQRMEIGKPAVQNATPQESDYVAGTALCFHRDVVKDIGLLDPRFYFYFEEVDWCRRASSAGYRILLLPRCLVWHHVSATIGIDSPATTYYMTRNAFLFFAKNFQGFEKWWALTTIWFRELRTILTLSLKQNYRGRTQNRDIRLLALRDVMHGAWGEMTPDAKARCEGVE